jgi:hypothetical protein
MVAASFIDLEVSNWNLHFAFRRDAHGFVEFQCNPGVGIADGMPELRVSKGIFKLQMVIAPGILADQAGGDSIHSVPHEPSVQARAGGSQCFPSLPARCAMNSTKNERPGWGMLSTRELSSTGSG